MIITADHETGGLTFLMEISKRVLFDAAFTTKGHTGIPCSCFVHLVPEPISLEDLLKTSVSKPK